jgi:hypothetical protein
MKRKKRHKAPGNLDVLLLRDLSPVEDVRGGFGKRLFGERAVARKREPQPPRVTKERKAPKD